MCDCGGGGSQAQAEIKTTGLPPKVVIIGRAAVGKTRQVFEYIYITYLNDFARTER